MRLETVGDRRELRAAWVDASCGVAGDMLLAALLDAGASLEVVRRDVEAVLPGAVRVSARPVTRGAMRATKVDVELVAPDQPHRAWRDIRARIEAADLPGRVRHHALAAFGALAEAEGRVHGVAAADVHFHEVGSWDSIADVIGVCSALEDLGVGMLFVSPIALGDGFVRAAHGVMPVPVPAVLELLSGAQTFATGLPMPVHGSHWHGPHADEDHGHHHGHAPHGHDASPGPVGELATPTGVALLVALADGGGPGMMPGDVGAVGVGAGTRDGFPWPNVVRVVLSPDRGEAAAEPAPTWGDDLAEEFLSVLEANVDDLDPRAWPSVLDALLGAGARDAWLTPVVMKKGRPAHVVAALTDHEHEDAVRERLFRTTSTFGVRSSHVQRAALAREWVAVPVTCGDATADVRIKVGHLSGEIVRATPEFEDAAALAARAGAPVADALAAASAAAHAAGYAPGRPFPDPSAPPGDTP